MRRTRKNKVEFKRQLWQQPYCHPKKGETSKRDEAAGKATRVCASLGVRHAWGKLSQNRTMALEGSSSFTVVGAPLARNTALVGGLQAEMALSRYSALVLGYNGEHGSSDQSACVAV